MPQMRQATKARAPTTIAPPTPPTTPPITFLLVLLRPELPLLPPFEFRCGVCVAVAVPVVTGTRAFVGTRDERVEPSTTVIMVDVINLLCDVTSGDVTVTGCVA